MKKQRKVEDDITARKSEQNCIFPAKKREKKKGMRAYVRSQIAVHSSPEFLLRDLEVGMVLFVWQNKKKNREERMLFSFFPFLFFRCPDARTSFSMNEAAPKRLV
jgi:hypothetical protein